MTDVEYLDSLYRGSADPWHLTSSWYEQRKRALTMAALPRQRYRTAFEAGCSIGELTMLLAGRCDQLLSVDLHADAVRAARERIGPNPAVRIEQKLLPGEWPDEAFELIVLSEIGYFVNSAEWRAVCEKTAVSSAADATVLACHWLHPFEQRTQPTVRLHAELAAALGWPRVAGYADADFVIDVWSSDPLSVAEGDGLR